MADKTTHVKLTTDTSPYERAMREMKRVSDKTNRDMSDAWKNHGQVIKSTGTLIAGAAIGIGAAYAATMKTADSKFTDFETALVDMGKVSDRSFKDLRADVMGIDPVLGSATELMKGYYQVISAGVTDPVKSLEMLTTTAKAAKAAHVEQSEVIKGITKVMAGYGGEIATAADAADLLFTIEKVGQTSVAELIPVIGSLAKVSADLNIKQTELGGTFAQITQVAGNTEEASVQYMAILTGLMKPTEDMKKALDDMGKAHRGVGFESAQAAIGQLGLHETLKKLKESTGGSATKMAALFANVRATKGIAAASVNNFDDLGNKIDEMGKKAGAMDAAFEKWKVTAAAAKEVFKNTLHKVLIDIGEDAAPKVMTFLTNFSKWLSENQSKIVSAFGAMGDVVGWMAEKVTGVSFNTDKLNQETEKQLKLLKEIASWEERLADLEKIKLLPGAYKGAKDDARFEIAKLNLELKRSVALTTELMNADTVAARKRAANAKKVKLEIEAAGKSVVLVGNKFKVLTAEQEKEFYAKLKREAKAIDKGKEDELKSIMDFYDSQWAQDDKDEVKTYDKIRAEAQAIDKGKEDELAAIMAYYTEKGAQGDKDWAKTAEQIAAELTLKTNLLEQMGVKDAAYFAFKQTLADTHFADMKAKYEGNAEMIEIINAAELEAAKKLNQDKTLASDDFFGGLLVAHERALANQKTWAKSGLEIYNQFTTSSRAAFSDIMFDAIKGDLKDFSDYWSSFWDAMLRKITDIVAEMAVQWAIAKGVKLIGDLFFHEGAWNIKEDEQAAILQRGEMVINKDTANQVRGAFGSEAGFEDFVNSYNTAAGGSLSPAQQAGFGAFGRNMAVNVAGVASQVVQDTSLFGPGLAAMVGSIPTAGLAGLTVGLERSLGFGVGLDMPTKVGTQLATALGGAIGGPFGAAIAHFGATIGLNAIGDMLNTRSFEPARDFLEDKYGYWGAQSAIADFISGYGKTDPAGLAGMFGPNFGYGGDGDYGEGYGSSLGTDPGDPEGGGEGLGGSLAKHGGWLHGPESGYNARLHGKEFVMNEDQVNAVRELNMGAGGVQEITINVMFNDSDLRNLIRVESDDARVNAEQAGLGTQRAYF